MARRRRGADGTIMLIGDLVIYGEEMELAETEEFDCLYVFHTVHRLSLELKARHNLFSRDMAQKC